MRRSPRFLLLVSATLLLSAAMTLCVTVLLHAHRVLRQADDAVKDRRMLGFRLVPLDPAARRAAGPAFEPVAAPESFLSGAVLADRLYLSGPTGISIYGPDGGLQHELRTGQALPASAPGRVAVGRLRGSAEPQLLVATDGAGVLILTPGSDREPLVQQLLPNDPELREITALAATPAGDLILGTMHRGLLVFTGDTLAQMPVHLDGLDAGRLGITTLTTAGPEILAGTRTAGLLLLRAGTVERIDASSGLPDDEVESVAAAGGRVWVGTPVGVAELDVAGPAHAVRMVAPGLFAHALAFDRAANTLTVGTMDQGLVQVPLDAHARLHPASLALPFENATGPADAVSEILSEASGTYALVGARVLHRTGAAWQPVIQAAGTGLSNGNVSALAFSPEGRLWVGFFDRGLDILNPDLTRASHLEDDRLFCLNRLVVDPVRHTMAAATANGLVLFDAAGHARQALTRADGLISEHINDLAFTPAGLALATPAGITFLDASGPSSLYAFQGLVNNHVYTLGASAAGAGELLAGTLGGISVLEAGQVRRNLTATNSGLRHNWITAILPLPEVPHTWLIGTYGAGIERLTIDAAGTASFTPIELPAGSPRDLVINPNAMLATPAAIYAGTLDHGMLVYDRTAGRWSLVTAGLPSFNVTAFAARGQGSTAELFLGTENGLLHISEHRLLAYANGGRS